MGDGVLNGWPPYASSRESCRCRTGPGNPGGDTMLTNATVLAILGLGGVLVAEWALDVLGL